MKATIKNSTNGPKAFFIGSKIQVLKSGEEFQGDFEDCLLQALKNTGFDVDHKGELKFAEAKPTKSAKADGDKIIADAKAEADKILAEAKAAADKMIAEAEDLTKGSN